MGGVTGPEPLLVKGFTGVDWVDTAEFDRAMLAVPIEIRLEWEWEAVFDRFMAWCLSVLRIHIFCYECFFFARHSGVFTLEISCLHGRWKRARRRGPCGPCEG